MKIQIEISDDVAAGVNGFLAWQDAESQANTHGHLDVAGLIEMLLEDVALAVQRSESWEGGPRSINTAPAGRRQPIACRKG
jgi:hypothetical protein